MTLSFIFILFFLSPTLYILQVDTCGETYHQCSFWDQELFGETGVISTGTEDICSRRISLAVNSTNMYYVSRLKCKITFKSVSLSSSLFTIKVLRAETLDDNYATLSMEIITKTNSIPEYKVFLVPLRNCTINVMAKSILLRFMMIYVDFEILVSEENSTFPLEPKCDVVEYDGHYMYYPVKYILNDIPSRSNLEMLVY